MSKSSVNDVVDKIQRRADYVPQVVDSDLDTLTLDILNDNLKVVKQLFLDRNLLDEISSTDTFTTVASTETIAISSETVDLDQPFNLYEKVNDTVVMFLPFRRFRELYTDASSSTSTTADHFAFFNNNLYLGPTPSTTGTTYYFDYIKLIAAVVAGSTMPFEAKYDPLLIAMCKTELLEYLDPKNLSGIALAQTRSDTLRDSLVINAAKNIGMNQQTQPRRDTGYVGPRMVK